jgi:hypothetical protein
LAAVTPDARSDQFAYISMNYDGTGFFGYVENAGGKILEEGEWPTVEDALAWARAQATMVRLIYGRGDDCFSAGEQAITCLPAWPPDAATRERLDESVVRALAGDPPPREDLGTPPYVEQEEIHRTPPPS